MPFPIFRNPSDWVIVDAGGGNINATNVRTGAVFNGTIAGFNAAVQAMPLSTVLDPIITSASAPVNADGRPDGTVYIQHAVGTFVKVAGTYVNCSAGGVGGAAAWVNFNGIGTVSIRGSSNVTSITDNGVGDYTINFTTPMVDTNYAVVGTTKYDNAGGAGGGGVIVDVSRSATAFNTNYVNIRTAGTVNSASLYDCHAVCVAIFR